jgi:hypothetical protein
VLDHLRRTWLPARRSRRDLLRLYPSGLLGMFASVGANDSLPWSSSVVTLLLPDAKDSRLSSRTAGALKGVLAVRLYIAVTSRRRSRMAAMCRLVRLGPRCAISRSSNATGRGVVRLTRTPRAAARSAAAEWCRASRSDVEAFSASHNCSTRCGLGGGRRPFSNSLMTVFVIDDRRAISRCVSDAATRA